MNDVTWIGIGDWEMVEMVTRPSTLVVDGRRWKVDCQVDDGRWSMVGGRWAVGGHPRVGRATNNFHFVLDFIRKAMHFVAFG